jgi:hypothetical protein
MAELDVRFYYELIEIEELETKIAPSGQWNPIDTGDA